MTTTIHEIATDRTIAVVNPKAKARVTRWQSEPAVVQAKALRHTVTREPDMLDEATGEAVWLADTQAVIVPLERLDQFRAYVNCRGLSTCGRGTHDVVSTIGQDPDLSWDALFEAVRP